MANPRQVGGYNFHPQFANDRDALIRAMYAEAGNQSDKGKLDVGYNIRNRADAGYLGKHGIQDTILAQNKSGRGGQYSSFLANRPNTNIAGRNAMALDPNGAEYQKLGGLADQVLGRMAPDPTMGASHYYAPQGMPGGRAPGWAKSPQMTYLGQEGAHKFYQEKGFNPQQPDTPMRMGDETMLASSGPDGRMQAFQTAMSQSPQPTMVANASDANVPPVRPVNIASSVPTPPVRPANIPTGIGGIPGNAPSSAEFLRANYGRDLGPSQPGMQAGPTPILQPLPQQQMAQNNQAMGMQPQQIMMAEQLRNQNHDFGQFDPFGMGGDGFGLGGGLNLGSLFG